MADANSTLYIRPALTAVAIKYRQAGLIADAVMPRIPVDKQEFVHLADRMGEWLTPPDTQVGRNSRPNQLSNSAQDPTQLATVNQGLDEPVPNQDAMNGPTETALSRATQRVMGQVQLRREIRVASILSTSGNFAYNTTYSVSTSQWNDYVNSTPLKDLLTWLDKPFMRPNKIGMGQDVWTILRQHPKVLEAIFWAGGNSGGQAGGLISREQLAALLEVNEIIIGQGWYNSANKGQAVTKTRVWGKNVFGIYQDSLGGPDGGANTWGYTAQFGEAVAGTIPDPYIGLFGGENVRAGESVREVVAAPEFGFLLSQVIP